MSDFLGSFVLVLHGHLPYVLRHGTWPHGEDWLYEAAAETYMPLLNTIGECALMQGRPRLTMGLTPVLLEQLAHSICTIYPTACEPTLNMFDQASPT